MADLVQKKFTLINEFYFYKIIFIISNFFIFAYYQILLYKETGSFSVLVIDWLIFHIVMWIGFIIGSFVLEKLGYVHTFKLTFFMIAIATLIIALNLDNIVNFYIIFAIIRGFPRGFFWPIHHTYLLREFNVGERNSVISSIESLVYILSIIFPVLVGSVLSASEDYALVFLAGSMILFTASLVPWKYNKKPNAQITSGEIIKIFKAPKFKTLAVLNIIGAGMDVNIALIFVIVPYLFLRSEFEVGILASGLNLLAGILVFARRKRKIKDEIKIGYIAHTIYSIAVLAFVFIWTLPAMLIRGLISLFTGSMYGPLEQKIDLKVKSLILNKNTKESAAELNIITETLYLIGRVIALSILLVLVNLKGEDSLLGFKIFVFIQGIWYFVYYVVLVRLLKPKQKEEIVERSISSHPNGLFIHK